MSLRFSKKILAGFTILAMAIAFMFASSMEKAHASVSWGQEVTAVGMLSLGKPYKWNGTTPKGFDASGYTQYAFKTSAAKMTLPHSSKEQYKLGKAVTLKNLKEGDLVFFNTSGKGVSFVGIYLNKDQFLAVTVNKGVSIQSLSSKYWKDRYVGAKRVLKEY
ncbi:C40 family peptidase [Neobacillus terrae]|uniref:C40 family peptidase n=1 Tax=Neobacillus terrae TaxID=3034837 RepID=UPI00140A7EA3|nr:C40 family peptidase [Neobacillus terrae]NHM32726.1 C40 family peptidase [Neobacillus terrae]